MPLHDADKTRERERDEASWKEQRVEKRTKSQISKQVVSHES